VLEVKVSFESPEEGVEGDEGGGESKGAIAMSFGGLDIPIWNDMLGIMEPQIEDAGYDFLTDDPQWDIQPQVFQFYANLKSTFYLEI
jgi:hypothetical protein